MKLTEERQQHEGAIAEYKEVYLGTVCRVLYHAHADLCMYVGLQEVG